MEREYIDFLQDIVDEIDNIAGFLEGINYEQFCNDKMCLYAVEKSLENIGGN
ncbi:MAG: hypothetical protein WCP79_11995 [Bacillota bacterium]